MLPSCRSRWIPLLLVGLSLGGTKAWAQTNAGALLAQLSQAVFGGAIVHGATLTGEATWYAGSLKDAGSAAVTVDTTGNMKMTFTLAKLGSHSEVFVSGNGLGSCQWAGANGVAHSLSGLTCWRPILAPLPALSLQPSLLLSDVGVVDLGNSQVGAEGNTYRHLQAQLVSPLLSSEMVTELMSDSTTDLGLDPTTYLPAVLAYKVHPDDGSAVLIPIEMRYSAYQPVNGVQVPFHIERYVNGTLQLVFSVSTVTLQ